jgi:iron-sulfur cluster repair protein YtfE (RIC family)
MLTDPIRTEHSHLRPHVRQLRELADRVGELTLPALRAGVAQAHAFLASHLIPHARAEDRTLYPVVAGLMGATDATRTMSRDHVEVVLLTEQLASLRAALEAGAPDAQQVKALRRVLYGLHAIVELHFAKEEEIYLPLLDRGLSEEGARELFLAMQSPSQAQEVAH